MSVTKGQDLRHTTLPYCSSRQVIQPATFGNLPGTSPDWEKLVKTSAKLSVRCAWFLRWALAPAGVEKRVEEPE